MARTVFITGASGAVGGWVARACLERGDRIVVLQRSAGPPPDERCAAVRGDLLADGVVERALREHEADTVFHLAAHVVGVDARSPVLHAAGSDLRPEITGTAPGGGAALDATRLRELTGWRPRVELGDGLRRTLDWYRSHPSVLD